MKLARPFFRLPMRFDVARLAEEVAAIDADAWAKHPNDIKGNTSVRLISVDGGENDDVDGAMLPTLHFERSPYLRQVLASFNVVWSRSRLLKLAPFADVPQHADINYHWFNRVRLHIPIVTHPNVRFYCGDEDVHMAAGDAWIFDNWRLHRVDNPVAAERVHLVADTSGSGSFWQMVGQNAGTTAAAFSHRYAAGLEARPLTERTALSPVMPPAEVDLLVLDLQAELAAPNNAAADSLPRYWGLLDAFRRDWRQLYQLFGESDEGRPQFEKLRDSVRAASKEQAVNLTMRTNGVAAHTVLEGRVLRAVLPRRAPRAAAPTMRSSAAALRRPIFIVAAPRSGSTLLFETLAASDQACTVGGEAHWLVESIPELRVGAVGVESNRLTAAQNNEAVGQSIMQQIRRRLQDNQGRALPADAALQFLEKTPKNALRVPFFNSIFPDALFVFLWRDPRDNLSSIMEAWRSGGWQTYDRLAGFEGPWSLLLPPGWAALSGKPLNEIAAFQWETTNRLLLDDLQKLENDRWTSVSYADLVADPTTAIRRICAFLGWSMDASLTARLANELPLSRFTQTPPAREKWRKNEVQIMAVMPQLQATWQRLQALR